MELRPNDPITKINNNDYKLIVGALERDGGWRKVVDFLGIFQSSKFLYVQSPGEKLFWELRSKLCTVQMLCDLLRRTEQYDALSVLCKERLKIIKQPSYGLLNDELFLRRGADFNLEFDVWGLPQPEYRWYKGDAILGNTSVLTCKFNVDMQGEYFCLASQVLENGDKDVVKSNVIKVQMLPERCVILRKPPDEIFVIAGNQISLRVSVDGYPPPKYQWMLNNTVLKNETTNKLTVEKSSKKHEGIYRCVIANQINELTVKVKVVVHDSLYIFPECKDAVIKKVALLIGNKIYQHQSSLLTPEDDVSSLATILTAKGFHVIAFINLNLQQLKGILNVFCSTLTEGAIALFYYAGHGFELGDKFLLPVDAPDPENFRLQDCVSECQILQAVLNKRPKLFLQLMDMCLKLPDRSQNPKIYDEQREIFEYKPDRNLIQGYSTTTSLSSYERSNRKYSLYNEAIKKYLAKDLSVLKMLAKVNHELEKVTKNAVIKQIPYISFNVVQDFYLNVPVTGK